MGNCIFVFVSLYFLISSLIYSVIHWLFHSILFSIHGFVFYAVFFFYYSWCLVSMGLEKMLDIISVFLNLLRLVLWPRMWSILDNVPCVLEKNVHMFILLLEDRMICVYLLSPCGLICPLRPVFPYYFSVWIICPLM